jgi:hypothetical protein
MGVSAIKDSDVEAASAMASLDSAALHLQKIAGITDGDVAGVSLSEKEWLAADRAARAEMLRAWLENEILYEKD